MTDSERPDWADGREWCAAGQHWIKVTKAGRFYAHRRQDPNRWLTVPCEGSGTEAP